MSHIGVMQTTYLLGYLRKRGDLGDIYAHKHDKILFKDFLKLKTYFEYKYRLVPVSHNCGLTSLVGCYGLSTSGEKFLVSV